MSDERRAEVVAILERPPSAGDATGQVREAVGQWSREAELAQFRRS